MAGPPTTVWVEVSTELLAEMGDWSDPVQVRIHDLRPNGQVEMEFRRPSTAEGWRLPDADTAGSLADAYGNLLVALRLLDSHTLPPDEEPCHFDHHGGCQAHGFLALAPGEKCPTLEAQELLVRHGIRKA